MVSKVSFALALFAIQLATGSAFWFDWFKPAASSTCSGNRNSDSASTPQPGANGNDPLGDNRNPLGDNRNSPGGETSPPLPQVAHRFPDYDLVQQLHSDSYGREAMKNGVPENHVRHESGGHAHSLQNEIEAEQSMQALWMREKILHYLGLSEAPHVQFSAGNVPAPLLSELAPEEEEERLYQRDEAEQSAGPSQTFTIAHTDPHCHTEHLHSICLRFHHRTEFAAGDIALAELWVYTRQESAQYSSLGLSFRLREISRHTHAKRTYQPVTVLRQQRDGWIALDMTFLAQKWARLSTSDNIRRVEIVCDACPRSLVIESTATNRAYLSVKRRETHSRQRRSIPWCQGSSNQQCCLQSWSFNFKENNMSFIVQPASIPANYCRGSCTLPDLDHGGNQHSLLLHRAGKSLCCVPRTYRSASVLYLPEDTPDQFLKTQIPLIAHSCTCT